MNERQKQLMLDITNMMPFVNIKFVQGIKNLFETQIEQEILKIDPTTEFEDMDVTEKIMWFSYISKSEEEHKKDEKESIPLEDCLKEFGLNNIETEYINNIPGLADSIIEAKNVPLSECKKMNEIDWDKVDSL